MIGRWALAGMLGIGCAGSGGGGTSTTDAALIACDIDDERFEFAADVEGEVDQDEPSLLVLSAGSGGVSLDTVVLRVTDAEGEADLADPFVGASLGFTLDLDPFTSQGLKGTAIVEMVNNDRIMGTFIAEIANTTDPSDVRQVRDGTFDVPLSR